MSTYLNKSFEAQIISAVPREESQALNVKAHRLSAGYLMAGLIGAAIAMGNTAHAEAALPNKAPAPVESISTPKQEKAAERTLKRKLIQKKEVEYYDGDISWVYVSSDRRSGTETTTRRPFVEKVRKKNGGFVTRYFEVAMLGEKPSDTIIGIIPQDDIEIVKSKTPKDRPKTYKAVAKLTNEGAYIKRATGKKKAKSVVVGHSFDSQLRVYREPQGTRYASQEMAEAVSEAKNIDQFAAGMQNFLNQYNVKLFISPTDVVSKNKYSINEPLSEADMARLRKYGPVFIDEWSKYPKDFISSVGIKSVTLAKSIIMGDRSLAGLAGTDETGNVILRALNPTVYDSRQVLHHEVGHSVAYKIFNNYQSASVGSWLALNPVGFAYTQQINPGCSFEKCPPSQLDPNFISKYSMYNDKEEHAELFAHLMMGGSDQTGSPLLSQKVQYFKNLLVQSLPLFTEEYFFNLYPRVENNRNVK